MDDAITTLQFQITSTSQFHIAVPDYFYFTLRRINLWNSGSAPGPGLYRIKILPKYFRIQNRTSPNESGIDNSFPVHCTLSEKQI